MPQLIACLSTGKGTWGHVARLLESPQWTTIILLTNDYGKENFNTTDKVTLLVINERMGLKELREDIKTKLKPHLKDSEVGVNFISGTGKEHMALMSALLQLGVGIRLIALTKDGVEEI